VLLLGINPGGPRQVTHLDTDLQPHDFLLEGPKGPRYWSNARTFFSMSPELRRTFTSATFAFCCPYRTASWSDLTPRQREVLVEVSRPVLRQIFADCRPKLVTVAGRAGFDVLSVAMQSDLVIGSKFDQGGTGGTYQWSASRGRLGGDDLVVVQLPHFSLANSSPRLQECAQWLWNGFRRWGVTLLAERSTD